MSSFNLESWIQAGKEALVLSFYGIGGAIILDTPVSPSRIFDYRGTFIDNYHAIFGFILLSSLAAFWQGQVTQNVPDPYLDEIFHIPQAQAYCNGEYNNYDPKLTTPPGLYGFAVLFSKIWFNGQCSVYALRLFNVVALLVTMAYACDSRTIISKLMRRDIKGPLGNDSISMSMLTFWHSSLKEVPFESLHTALNIALFPPLFFFSGLFYTDVLSTCMVLRAYRLFLEREGAYYKTSGGLIWIYITGMIALTMRQTNIFWVAIFLGGSELVRTIKSDKSQQDRDANIPRTWQETIVTRFKMYSRGEVHDVSLRDAGITDFILCPISIVVATIYQPIKVLTRLWTYIALLVSFAAFVLWNGGVVLGDKSNHVATIHLPQMLYIWPLIAFFSAPIIIPVGISFLQNLLSLLALPLFPRLVWKYLLVTAYMLITLIATLVIIRYNTIIHPFTLADNRHYMFYIFRYTLLRHPLIRYLFAPVYLTCAYLVYLALCAPNEKVPVALALKKGSGELSKATKLQKNAETTTSFLLILLITTTLSLITAPLVEPRYFIIPWVIWRLNIPSVNTAATARMAYAESLQLMPDEARRYHRDLGLAERLRMSFQNHDYRLYLETAWFLSINFVTGYIFLYRGFEWKQEPGNVQRFMW